MKKLVIPQPCHENWNNMSPTQKGAFCSACEKEVIDFTKTPQYEAIQTIEQNSGNICGRFRKDQIHTPIKNIMRIGILATLAISSTSATPSQTDHNNASPTTPLTIEQGFQINGSLINRENNKPIDFAICSIFHHGKLLSVTHSDIKGKFCFKNITLSKSEITLIVNKDGYESELIFSDQLQESMELEVNLTSNTSLKPKKIIPNPPPPPQENTMELIEIGDVIIEYEEEISETPQREYVTLGLAVCETIEVNKISLNNPEEELQEEKTSIENKLELKILAYPNPAQNFITLKTNLEGEYLCDLYDLNGALILSNNFNGNQVQINISELASAYYIIQLKDLKSGNMQSIQFTKLN